MSDLFISYRRQDVPAYVERLYDALAQRYGNDRVVFDINDLAPGQDFAKQLHDAVAASKCVLVVIGPQWLTATDANGRRRIDDPGDFIRSEVAAALRDEKYVIPMLVAGAAMPTAAALPQELEGIARRQAVLLNNATWQQDLLGLYQVLDPLLNARRAAPTVSPAVPQPAARHSFMARILAAFDVLTGRTGNQSKEPSVADAPPPRRSPPVQPSTRASEAAPARAADAGKQVFVSYAEEDQPLADEVVRVLEERGHACWIAHRNIPPGTQSWAGPIVAAIANSRVALILVTTYAVASKQVLREITVADDENIPLIPVCIDNVSLSKDFRYFFSSPQRLELDDLSHDQIVQRIGSAVERHLSSS